MKDVYMHASVRDMVIEWIARRVSGLRGLALNLFSSCFTSVAVQTVASVHSYNTRLASKSTYYINTIKTNYGKFNIRFAAVKVWNHLDESIKYLPLKTFKNKVKLNILQSYCS